MDDVKKHMTEEDGRSEVMTAQLPGKRVDSARDVFLYLIRFFPSDHMKTLNMTSSALFLKLLRWCQYLHGDHLTCQ